MYVYAHPHLKADMLISSMVPAHAPSKGTVPTSSLSSSYNARKRYDRPVRSMEKRWHSMDPIKPTLRYNRYQQCRPVVYVHCSFPPRTEGRNKKKETGMILQKPQAMRCSPGSSIDEPGEEGNVRDKQVSNDKRVLPSTHLSVNGASQESKKRIQPLAQIKTPQKVHREVPFLLFLSSRLLLFDCFLLHLRKSRSGNFPG